MLDRSKCKKMLVWDNDSEEKKERIVVEFLNGGGCYAVEGSYTEDFNNGRPFFLTHWENYEEIPEKKPFHVLDVMWAEGVRNVMRVQGTALFYCSRFITSDECASVKEFNKLIKKDGVVQLEGEWKTAEEFYRKGE